MRASRAIRGRCSSRAPATARTASSSAREYGTVHVWPNDPNASEMKTFLDIRDRVQYDDKQNEEGFLGLAFHPKFKENGEFFVYYSAKPTKENPHVTVDFAVSRFEGRPQRGRSEQRRSAHDDQAAVLEPQRRHDRLRSGWLPLYRPGRRRRPRRPARQRPEPQSAARQDPADRRRPQGSGT